jgi:16S rRNA processing protein RimM
LTGAVNPDDLRAIGVVVGAHGLQGTVKLQSLSDFPERFSSLKAVTLRRGNEVLGPGHVKRIKWAGPYVLVSLTEYRTREAAEGLLGVEFCVADKHSWQLPEDVYYMSDLIGFTGVSEDGTRLGILRTIVSGAQDIFEFEREGESLLVPFVCEWVGRVNVVERTIEILNWRSLLESDTVEPSPEPDDH